MTHNSSCLLSIIVPAYNSEAWIHECIESIIISVGNNFNEVELLIINDGSDDRTANIINEYSDNYNWIYAFHKENGGVSSARNLGLKNSKGNYIAWIDSDDWVSVKWYGIIHEAMMKDPDVIQIDHYIVYESTSECVNYGNESGAVDVDQYINDIAADIRLKSGFCDKVIKKALFNNIEFNECESILEDYIIILDVLLSARTIYYQHSNIYYYRQRLSSLLHTDSPKTTLHCVDIAKRRAASVPDKYRESAITGVMVQMLMFCRARAFDTRYKAFKSEYKEFKDYTRKNLSIPLRNTRIPTRWKAKFILLAAGLFPMFVRDRRDDIYE